MSQSMGETSIAKNRGGKKASEGGETSK